MTEVTTRPDGRCTDNSQRESEATLPPNTSVFPHSISSPASPLNNNDYEIVLNTLEFVRRFIMIWKLSDFLFLKGNASGRS
jgi:hypothetical protein